MRRFGGVKQTTRSFYVSAVHRALGQVLRSLDDAVDLGALAREAALAPLHFHRIFRGMVGETPLELHRRLRLERAARHLCAGDAPVTRVAFDAGYETHESFTRAFRDAYASSPSEFRARAREAAASGAPLPMVELAAPTGIHFTHAFPQNVVIQTREESSTMHVDVMSMSARRLATVAHRGPYNTIAKAFERLGELAGPCGLFETGVAAMLAIYHDDPDATPPAELRSDAGIVVPEGVTLPKGLTETRIAAGRFARTTHVGPYNLLGDAWSRFMGTWLPSSGHRLGPLWSYEHYLNTPMTASPSELRTDLYISLAE